MAQGKVRCVECGAKNTDTLAERCRICGGLLPDAARRRLDRLGAATAGPSFNVIVENEVATWNAMEDRATAGPRSRRPKDDEEDGDRRRWGRRRRSD